MTLLSDIITTLGLAAVPAYTVYGGNPARFIKERFDGELKSLLLRFRWWDLPPEQLTDILPILCAPDLQRLRPF